MIDTPGFVKFAQSGLDRLIGTQIPGGEIGGIKSYLTGECVMDDDFTIKRYNVVDKHDFRHSCFNAKLNVTDRSGKSVLVGCLDRDLEGFTALASDQEENEVVA